MIIKGGFVYQEDKSFAIQDLYIENGRIVSNREQLTDTTTIDAENLLVLPGLIDIHSHGAVGHDISDGDMKGLKNILKYQHTHGVTSYCPTTMTLPKEKLLQIFHSIKDWKDEPGQSRMVGINMEGPFLDPEKRGAHRKDYIMSPDPDFFRECNKVCQSRIQLMTVAPNMDGALELIEELKDETVISLGHSGADYETAKMAFQTGSNHVTHLFNAMNPLNHRTPGLIAAASENESCMAELICDGIHVHESMVKAAFKLFPDRIVLISDSMRATGMGDGIYDLGGQQVTVAGNRAVLSDGTIAGSVTDLYDCMRKTVSFGIPMREAIAAATMNPAKSIGIFDRVGSLTPGKQADILLADKDLNLLQVITF